MKVEAAMSEWGVPAKGLVGAAQNGDPEAMFDLALRHEEGRGLPRDLDRAVYWMRRAAEAGHSTAQYNLGVLYASGLGVPRDPAEGIRWFRAAAEKGCVRAEFMLGTLYYHGDGGPRDLEQAWKWLSDAAARATDAASLTPEQAAEARYLAGRAGAETDAPDGRPGLADEWPAG